MSFAINSLNLNYLYQAVVINEKIFFPITKEKTDDINIAIDVSIMISTKIILTAAVVVDFDTDFIFLVYLWWVFRSRNMFYMFGLCG